MILLPKLPHRAYFATHTVAHRFWRNIKSRKVYCPYKGGYLVGWW